MNILIVIPVYNNENTCNKLINEIISLYDNDILIIDDGSKTPFKLKINKNQISVISYDKNKGKGYALKTAIKYSLKYTYTHILTIDSDYQHDPKFIKSFLDKREDVKIVYGKRKFDNNMPFMRICSNKITSNIISYLKGFNIYDTQCGFRRYSINLFDNIILCENGYQFESELLLKCVYGKNEISYIEIPTIYNRSKSNINNIFDTVKFIKMIFKIIKSKRYD